MKKRNLFAEIAEGFDALSNARAGKQTLRTHEVEINPAPDVTADELLALRERLHLSRPVFARYLRTNPRTLENWEQGLLLSSLQRISAMMNADGIDAAPVLSVRPLTEERA